MPILTKLAIHFICTYKRVLNYLTFSAQSSLSARLTTTGKCPIHVDTRTADFAWVGQAFINICRWTKKSKTIRYCQPKYGVFGKMLT